MKKTLKKLAHQADLALSTRLVQPWRLHRRYEEQHMGKLLRYLNVDCVFDVGANIGQYAMMLRDYAGYQGRILSFEPTPGALQQLKANSAADARWEVFGYALGDHDGEAQFNMMDASSEGNSFLALAAGEGDTRIEQVQIEVRKLDSVFSDLKERFGFKRPFLKMDTQGYDLAVFAGAQRSQQQMVGLQSELSLKPFYVGAPDWKDSLQVYQDSGFVLSALVPNNDQWFPYLRELDCIMFRPGDEPSN
jgi:FkbM family methyltransferase